MGGFSEDHKNPLNCRSVLPVSLHVGKSVWLCFVFQTGTGVREEAVFLPGGSFLCGEWGGPVGGGSTFCERVPGISRVPYTGCEICSDPASSGIRPGLSAAINLPASHRVRCMGRGERETERTGTFVAGRNLCFSENIIFMENINQLSSKSSELRKWSGREKAAMWPDVMYF